jgi:hypothetical protein
MVIWLPARIDRVPTLPRQVLRTAAVLGQGVFLPLFTALWEGKGEPAPHCNELTRLEFLYVRPGTAEPVYVCKHVLTQEVAYEGLLLAPRQVLPAAAERTPGARYAGRIKAWSHVLWSCRLPKCDLTDILFVMPSCQVVTASCVLMKGLRRGDAEFCTCETLLPGGKAAL